MARRHPQLACGRRPGPTPPFHSRQAPSQPPPGPKSISRQLPQLQDPGPARPGHPVPRGPPAMQQVDRQLPTRHSAHSPTRSPRRIRPTAHQPRVIQRRVIQRRVIQRTTNQLIDSKEPARGPRLPCPFREMRFHGVLREWPGSLKHRSSHQRFDLADFRSTNATSSPRTTAA